MSLENFSLEWLIHTVTQYDSHTGTRLTERTFVARTGFDVADISGKLILDVGCGAGRYLDIVQRYGGIGIGIDASKSVMAARQNLDDSVDLIQADMLHMPLRPCVFDKIYSLGVIHHTPDARAAFREMTMYLKIGGELAVSVYSNEGVIRRYSNSLGSIARRFASIMELQTLYHICAKLGSLPMPRALLTKPFSDTSKLRLSPALILNFFLPFLSNIEDKDWRLLDTFDYLSPKYQTKHTYAEVILWFRESGFTDIEELPIPVSVKGRRQAGRPIPPEMNPPTMIVT